MYYGTQDGSKLDTAAIDDGFEGIEEFYDSLEDEINKLKTDKSIGELLDKHFIKYLNNQITKQRLDENEVKNSKSSLQSTSG